MTFPTKKIIALSLLFLMIGSNAVFAVEHKNITSYRELRYQNLFGQTNWWSCGPATVATILNYYYHIPVTELDVIELVVTLSDNDSFLTEGISLLLIKQIFESFGIEAVGYKIEPVSLLDYFTDGGLPLILYFTKPKKHYVLCIGTISASELLVSDPSFGHLTININALEELKGFEGIVMLAIPPTEQDFYEIKDVQNKMLERYQQRHLQLRALR